MVAPGTILGNLTEETWMALGLHGPLPYVTGATDKACETLGSGAINENCASISFGTAATVQINTRKYVEPGKFLPAYPAAIEGFYNPERQVYRGYWMVSWFTKEFGWDEIVKDYKSIENNLNGLLTTVPPGAGGLLLQPYWGPMLKYPEARGSIIGFTGDQSQASIYRAIIEGINYELMDGLETISRRAHTKIDYLTLAGGGSNSQVICQITADMFGLPIKKIQTYEACSIGAAIIAFLSIGQFENIQQAVSSMVYYKETFSPNMELHKFYANIFNKRYKKLYKSLQKIYKNIDKYNRNLEHIN